MIKKANELKAIIYSFLQKNNMSENDIETFMTEEFLNSHYVIVRNETIIDFIQIQKVFGVEILTPYFEGDVDIIISELKEHCKDEIFTWSSQLEKFTVICNTRSSIDEDYYYQVPLCVSFECPNKLRDSIEKNLYSDENLDNLTVLDLSSQEYEDFLRKNSCLMWSHKNTKATISVAGFFFLDDYIGIYKVLLLVRKNVIIGSIMYGCHNDRYTIAFIDVNMFYRNKGVAKKLILELAKVLDGENPLILSKETSMGKFCNMHKHFKEAPFKVPVLDNMEWRQMMEKKND